MSNDTPATVDFETEKIEARPWYPPPPASLALRHQDGRKEFLAWGHPSGNNCDRATARSKLRDIYLSGAPVLFHNGSFDLDVAEIYFGLRPPPRVEDSLFLAFLNNPHEETIALKPLGEKYLGMPPEEQDDLRDWIQANVPEAKRKKKEWGAYISRAPGSIVKPYALGDVDRTYKLWRKFRPEISERGMDEAYEREVRLIPITLEMERSGVRVDVNGLKKALRIFEKADEQLVRRIHKRLGVGSDFNVNSGPQLAKALDRADKLTARVLTPTGRQSTKISVLYETCSDKTLLNALSMHSVLEKYLSSFVRPWLLQAEHTYGYILPRFNQVRAKSEYGVGYGTRTGRYSSNDPNLQTVVANVEESKNREVLEMLQRFLKEEYGYDFIGLRDFFLPDEGQIITSIDYNQQEIRLLAHFERGSLAKAYCENPNLDVHEFFRQLIFKMTGELLPRKSVKVLVFGIVYGMGIKKLAASMGVDNNMARKIRAGLFEAVPGIQKLMNWLRELADQNKPLRTWGGREYYCEEPRMINGELASFEYKMLNQLIQPSAADMTKQGMIQVTEEVPQARIAIQVHDELVCMIPHRKYGPKIAEAMCRGKYNVPMTAEPKYSKKSWARVEKEAA